MTSHAFAETGLRICHVIHDTQVGGTETMLHRIVKGTHRRQQTDVISLTGCGPVGEQIRELGVPLHSIGCIQSGRPRFEKLPTLFSLLYQLQPDVVQTWGYHADLIGGVAARMMTRAAVVWNIRHATLDPAVDSRNVLRSARLCAGLSRFVPQKILSNSHAAIHSHAKAGYRERNMSVIPNGFDTLRFRPSHEQERVIRSELGIPRDAKVVGMCGRFHRHKGQDAFVRAASRLAASRANVHFLMAGKGCDHNNETLVTWIRSAGLESQFHLLGVRNDIPRVLNAMDVYLLPSITEGLPNVVGEAMACGVPVVATDVGDAGRLVGDCGIIVTVGDAEAMANGIETTLRADRHEARTRSERARLRIERDYSIRRIIGRYQSVWAECYAERHTNRKAIIAPQGHDPDTSASEPVLASIVPLPTTTGNTARPKILHFATTTSQSLFCSGKRIEALHRLGFDVHLASLGEQAAGETRGRPATVHQLSLEPAKTGKSSKQVWQLFREHRPAVVHLGNDHTHALQLTAIARAAGIPVRIVEFCAASAPTAKGTDRLANSHERLIASLCNASEAGTTEAFNLAKDRGVTLHCHLIDEADPDSVVRYYSYLLRREGVEASLGNDQRRQAA